MKRSITFVATLMAICLVASSTVLAQEQSNDSEKEQNNVRVFAQPERTSPYAKFKVSLTPAENADEVTVGIQVSIKRNWHIGPIDLGDSGSGLPTTIELESEHLTAKDQEFSPSVEPTTEKAGDDFQVFHVDTFKWTRDYKTTKPIEELAAEISVRFQVCDDTKCLPPKTMTFSLAPVKKSKDAKQSSGEIEFSHEKIGQPIEVSLDDCDKQRRRVKFGDVSTLSIIFSGIPDDSLDLTGQITFGSESFDFFLPKPDDGELSLINSGIGRTSFENTADYVSIDHNADGTLSDCEAVAMDGPIRIADSMFRVTKVDRKLKTITFQQIDAPLTGAIVGRKLPPFSFTTTEGETISNTSILGKVTILDIWAVT